MGGGALGAEEGATSGAKRNEDVADPSVESPEADAESPVEIQPLAGSAAASLSFLRCFFSSNSFSTASTGLASVTWQTADAAHPPPGGRAADLAGPAPARQTESGQRGSWTVERVRPRTHVEVGEMALAAVQEVCRCPRRVREANGRVLGAHAARPRLPHEALVVQIREPHLGVVEDNLSPRILFRSCTRP